jgi:uncharacterized membrane protein YoaK (UPF0700 family)
MTTTTDVELARVRKDTLWNVFILILAVAILVAGCFLGKNLIKPDQPLADSLKIIGVVTGVPAFLVIAAYKRISSDAITTVLGALIGFGVGKI